MTNRYPIEYVRNGFNIQLAVCTYSIVQIGSNWIRVVALEREDGNSDNLNEQKNMEHWNAHFL